MGLIADWRVAHDEPGKVARSGHSANNPEVEKMGAKRRRF